LSRRNKKTKSMAFFNDFYKENWVEMFYNYSFFPFRLCLSKPSNKKRGLSYFLSLFFQASDRGHRSDESRHKSSKTSSSSSNSKSSHSRSSHHHSSSSSSSHHKKHKKSSGGSSSRRWMTFCEPKRKKCLS